jgi:hypothetical protein
MEPQPVLQLDDDGVGFRSAVVAPLMFLVVEPACLSGCHSKVVLTSVTDLGGHEGWIFLSQSTR